MKNILVKFALWILDRYKINYFIFPNERNQIHINSLVDQVEAKFGSQSGEFKRSQVLRAALNSLPEVTEREIALAIELSMQRKSDV